MLRLHLWALSELPTASLAAVLVALSTERTKAEVPGYTNISTEVARLACPIELMRCPNNTLGSYGMYVWAYMRLPTTS